jgi:hypothetical protein
MGVQTECDDLGMAIFTMLAWMTLPIVLMGIQGYVKQ